MQPGTSDRGGVSNSSKRRPGAKLQRWSAAHAALGHRLDDASRQPPSEHEQRSWSLLEEAMRDVTELRAGAAGMLRLARTSADLEASALFAPVQDWESVTLYRVVRHRRQLDAAAALAEDIAEECRRLRLPRAQIEVLAARGIAGIGLVGRARLHLASAVAGPILLGRDRHFGGGLFGGCPPQRDGGARKSRTPTR
jgi:hypothetical protein